jgi:hypothetical protein
VIRKLCNSLGTGGIDIMLKISLVKQAANLDPARALVLEAEIARRDALVAGDILCRSGQDEFAELHDIGAVGDLQGGLQLSSSRWTCS